MVRTEIQIRFADIDMLRHVNNVTIQHYYDLGKSEYFQKVLHLGPMWTELGFVAAATQSNFREQIHLDSQIMVITRIIKMGTKSITVYQEIIDKVSNNVLSDSTSVMVAIDVQSLTSIPLPDRWKAHILANEKDDLEVK